MGGRLLEPLTALDQTAVQEAVDRLLEVAQAGLLAVLAIHHLYLQAKVTTEVQVFTLPQAGLLPVLAVVARRLLEEMRLAVKVGQEALALLRLFQVLL